ncbi:YegP family protein [Isoptericola sp. NPDC056134]|uniref:YegP family protein n=1 Tax=Isoptericola sp. NPDC056134 TaxID=3345723 RepID=UPI0035EF574E
MRIEIYKAADGWRWRLKARNGRIVAESGEAYVERRSAIRAVRRVLRIRFRPTTGTLIGWNVYAQWITADGTFYDLVEVAR